MDAASASNQPNRSFYELNLSFRDDDNTTYNMYIPQTLSLLSSDLYSYLYQRDSGATGYWKGVNTGQIDSKFLSKTDSGDKRRWYARGKYQFNLFIRI